MTFSIFTQQCRQLLCLEAVLDVRCRDIAREIDTASLFAIRFCSTVSVRQIAGLFVMVVGLLTVGAGAGAGGSGAGAGAP